MTAASKHHLLPDVPKSAEEAPTDLPALVDEDMQQPSDSAVSSVQAGVAAQQEVSDGLVKPHLHFMGIGGVGMSALASWCLADGHPVSGCDNSDSTELALLRAQGVAVESRHQPDHVANIDVLISTMAVPLSHPEILAARERGICTRRRIELLGDILEMRQSIAVTGTHGKSTTTGMVAHLLMEGDDDPSVLIGGRLEPLKGNVRYGRGQRLVAEVDESDPGFAKLRSNIAIITNLEDDHVAGDYDERRNYHASLADLEAATQTFAERADRVLYCADWPGLTTLLGHLPHACSYGFAKEADYRITGSERQAFGSRFDLRTPDGEQVSVALTVPGKHNIQNAAAALAGVHLAGLDLARAADALAGFRGVGRRWQRWGSVKQALIIDDYAHHPTEIRVTLETAKGTGRRVRAVLQPHRWVRTARLWPALAEAVSVADEILVLDIYSAGEQAIPGVSSALIVDELRTRGKTVSHHDISSAQDYLAGSLEPNDLVITLGAGDVWQVAQGLMQRCGGDDGSA